MGQQEVCTWDERAAMLRHASQSSHATPRWPPVGQNMARMTLSAPPPPPSLHS